MADEDSPTQRLTIRRGAFARFADWTRSLGERFEPYSGPFRAFWRKRWVKLLAVLAALPFLAYGILWVLFARDLPSAESLLNYQPALPTYVRAADGSTVQAFARERRVELAYEEYPQQLVDAFTSAEDKTFFEHGGIDWPGLAGAVVDYVGKAGSGERARGGSTITQQVAKNLLLGDEYSVTRKIKEAFLARRIEATLSKQQILELYLNQIFLGRNAYGVQAASRAYFDKDVDQLALHEVAFLAVLPRAPSNYDPGRNGARAIERRNWVLEQMERNGKINAAQRNQAQAQPLGTVDGPSTSVRNVGGYYMEEVRRILGQRYGENAESGPNSIYAGGLWVRTAFDPKMQQAAEKALRDGLMRYEAGRGWRDPGLSIPLEGNWRQALANANLGVGYDDWRAAVVLAKRGAAAEIGFVDGSTGTLPASLASMPKRGTGQAAFNALRPGAIIAVERQGDVWALRTTPEVSGGMVVEQVGTGRILALQGGFDVRGSNFNRATQAMRQPGSTFKPIVYAAAMQDGGMTPASIILDAPFCTNSGGGGNKCFRNFSGGYAGPQTMRWGLEQSRNLMTVRAANQVGMDRVVRLARNMGVGDYSTTPYLSISLGAGDTTVQQMTHAFATFASHGRSVGPSLIDYVQDRNGKVIFRADNRCQAMQGCNAPQWDGRAMPRPPAHGRQVVDPLTAYQVVHMLEGVVERGTATILRDLERPLFGKTGTTTGPTNVWFIGGSQEIVAGIYMGFDQPRPMGGYAQGGTLAAPIFRQFAKTAFEGMPVVPFRAPAGIRMVRIDRRSGRRVQGSWPTDDPRAAVIWEAFKPESEPRRSVGSDEVQTAAAPAPRRRRAAARPASDLPADANGRQPRLPPGFGAPPSPPPGLPSPGTTN
jgi:penicillin-binding protein 1A